jgi:carboxylesterase
VSVRPGAYDRVPPPAVPSMLRGYRTVVADPPSVNQPVLLIRSEQDHVVPAASSALILDRITSKQTEQVVLLDSYHERSLSFIDRISARGSGGIPGLGPVPASVPTSGGLP